MKKTIFLLALLLVGGCSDSYRYPCQDPANKDKEECNRPACEADGMCYDLLNGLPEQEASQVEEPAAPAANCNKTEESIGE